MNEIVNAEIKAGDRFRGNVNGAIIEVLSVEKDSVNYKDCKTGATFTYGLEAFKRCSLTKLEKEEEL